MFINFPAEEIKEIKQFIEKNGFIYTTRIDDELDKYKIDQETESPFGPLKIVYIKKFNNIYDHPFFDELTIEQVEDINGKEFCILKLVPVKFISKRAQHNYLKKKKEESGNITYIYSEKHIKERNKKKAKRVEKLAKSLNNVRKQVKKDIEEKDIKVFLPALAVALIDETYERVGNRYSAADLKHYGVTTWLVKHIKFSNSNAKINYIGKSGVKQTKEVKNKKLVSKLKEICKGKKPNDNVFEIDNYILSDNHVNQYLRKFNITAKDIRGLHANNEMRSNLEKVRKGKLPSDKKEKEKQLKKEFKEALDMTAEQVGHNPGTLKGQYLIPGFEDKYVTKGQILGPKVASLNVQPEEEVERLLLDIVKDSPFKGLVYSVGGYVRDKILGKKSKDLDIVIEKNGGAKELSSYLHDLFPEQTTRPLQLSSRYPIYHLVFKDNINYNDNIYYTKDGQIDLADTQKESFPDQTTRQREVQYGTLKEDIERRDFTTNMMLHDLTSGEIVDLPGTGKQDIEKGILRAHPAVSADKMFSDDPLRMMRLIRFCCKYDWQVPMNMIKAVKRNAEQLKKVSFERIQDELKKIMQMGKLYRALELMRVMGLLEIILPEIKNLRGVEQSEDHHAEGDVYKHTLEVLKNAKPTVEDQLAALFHDIGKPETQSLVGDSIHFYGHDEVGSKIAEAILRRLKFDNKTIEQVCSAIKNHMRPISLESASPKALRKFVKDVGEQTYQFVLDLAEADSLGCLPSKNYIPELREKIEKSLSVPIIKNPILNGQEIMDLLNIGPGPKIKEVKEYLLNLEEEYKEQGKDLNKDEAKTEIIKKFQ